MKRYRIIDGYNFLHAAGMMPRKIDGETLERARSQLVRYLSVRLTDQERALTTLVFDVNQNLGNLTARKVEAGMTILLAINYPDADSLIEELLKSHSAPKQVTVISSNLIFQKVSVCTQQSVP